MTSEGINIVALFVEKRRVIEWYAKINESNKASHVAWCGKPCPGGILFPSFVCVNFAT